MSLTKVSYSMITGAPVNVRDFGAVGNGVADDTAAIQAAINSFGGDAVNIYIPTGIYKTTAALNVLGNLGTIFGDGDNSIIAPVGAINVLVIGNGTDGVNFGTFRDFSIASSDGLQIRGIWGRLLRQVHFNNIVMRTTTVGLKNFSTAGIQCDFSYSCNLTSVTIVEFRNKGFWLGQDPLIASNQCNDFTLTGCQAFTGNGIGYHIKGSGNSLLGCLAEACAGGGVQGNFVPGINISGGYYENNGATSGFSFYFTEAQNAGGINNAFINNLDIAGTQCVVLDSVDTFVISGCNFRVNATGIGVELDTNVSNVYLIGNRNEGSTGTLYGGVSYPLNARISDTFTRFTDVFTTDFKTDSANKKAYSGRLSATPGDGTIFEIRGRQGVVIFAGDPNIPSITSTAIYSTTVGATNRDVFVDNTGLLGYVTSTRESKKNIETLDDVSWLLQLDPVSFNRRKKEIITDAGEKIGEQYLEETYHEKEYGLIADDVESVNKELCFYDGSKLAGVHYQKLITPLLKLVQNLHNEIEILKQR
jgi:Chaperone of endosialidase/Pectate lyase superfamily protein